MNPVHNRVGGRVFGLLRGINLIKCYFPTIYYLISSCWLYSSAPSAPSPLWVVTTVVLLVYQKINIKQFSNQQPIILVILVVESLLTISPNGTEFSGKVAAGTGHIILLWHALHVGKLCWDKVHLNWIQGPCPAIYIPTTNSLLPAMPTTHPARTMWTQQKQIYTQHKPSQWVHSHRGRRRRAGMAGQERAFNADCWSLYSSHPQRALVRTNTQR